MGQFVEAYLRKNEHGARRLSHLTALLIKQLGLHFRIRYTKSL